MKQQTARPERESTDGSLRAERDKTDRELGRKRLAIEAKADAVVSRARDKADDVVQTARDLADAKAPEQSAPAAQDLADERAVEDEALLAERSRADASVQDERAQRQRALASLLRLEREETDEHLMTERGHADHALGSRDVLLAMVSHDLRTLLGGIALASETMLREAPADTAGASPVRSRALIIQRAAARMYRIIGVLLDIAAVEAGTFVVQPTRQDLNALMQETVEMFQLSAAAHGVALEWQPAPQPVPALIDHDRIVQVLANLLTNALKFTPKGGAIALRLRVVDGAARASVSDTGTGIAAEHLEAIFDRFRQVGARDRRGLGLGLYISRCILDGHQGRIWAESVPGAGSTFFFTVPAA